MNDTPERWLPIPGHEGRYDVSDQGNVRSWVPYNGTSVPRTLATELNKHGYLRAVLYGDCRKISKRVHQLVMLAFVGPRPEGLETRHLDGNKLNNILTNLVYGTSSENRFDTVRHGTFNNGRVRQTHCQRGHEFSGTQGNRQVCLTCRRAIETRRPPRVR
jgi:hypothetical protein